MTGNTKESYLDNAATTFPKPPEVEHAVMAAFHTIGNAYHSGELQTERTNGKELPYPDVPPSVSVVTTLVKGNQAYT